MLFKLLNHRLSRERLLKIINPRAIVSASVFFECLVQEGDNSILRGGGGLGEASGAGGATLR